MHKCCARVLNINLKMYKMCWHQSVGGAGTCAPSEAEGFLLQICDNRKHYSQQAWRPPPPARGPRFLCLPSLRPLWASERPLGRGWEGRCTPRRSDCLLSKWTNVLYQDLWLHNYPANIQRKCWRSGSSQPLDPSGRRNPSRRVAHGNKWALMI